MSTPSPKSMAVADTAAVEALAQAPKSEAVVEQHQLVDLEKADGDEKRHVGDNNRGGEQGQGQQQQQQPVEGAAPGSQHPSPLGSEVPARERRRQAVRGHMVRFLDCAKVNIWHIVAWALALLFMVTATVLAAELGKLAEDLDQQRHAHTITVTHTQSFLSVASVTARADASYLDGVPGLLEDKQPDGLFKRSVSVARVASTTKACDNETTAPGVTSTSGTSTVTRLLTLKTIVTSAAFAMNASTVVAPFSNANATSMTFVSAAAITASLTASSSVSVATVMTASMSTSSETCGEWGDGHGPCTRPYGSPNATPASVLSTMSDAEVSPSVSNQSAGISITPVMSISSSTTDDMSATSAFDALSAGSTCGVSTTTVYVTLTPSSDASTSVDTTVTTTSTQKSLTTSTIHSSVAVTETLSRSNSTITTLTSVATANHTGSLSVPSFTLTLTSVAGSNESTTSTASPAGNTSPIPIASGGEQTTGKPLGMTSNTGNGVYCVVMLVSLLLLLL